jgi:hypothetical protein
MLVSLGLPWWMRCGRGRGLESVALSRWLSPRAEPTAHRLIPRSACAYGRSPAGRRWCRAVRVKSRHCQRVADGTLPCPLWRQRPRRETASTPLRERERPCLLTDRSHRAMSRGLSPVHIGKAWRGIPDRGPAHIRRCADVGTTPIVPTTWLCRPEDWIACGVGNSPRVGRHNPAGRADARRRPSGDSGLWRVRDDGRDGSHPGLVRRVRKRIRVTVAAGALEWVA